MEEGSEAAFSETRTRGVDGLRDDKTTMLLLA
jgi:hypothetical protein